MSQNDVKLDCAIGSIYGKGGGGVDKMSADFKGKCAVVTGSSGIGLDAGFHLARCGAKVFLGGIDPDLNKAAGERAAGEGLDISIYQLDVSDELSVRNWSNQIAGETNALHALVNAAGLQTYGTAEDTSRMNGIAV